MAPTDVVALRRAVLVAALDDVPVVAADAAAMLTVDDGHEVAVPWLRLTRALAGAPADSPAGRLRLRDWLLARQQVARLGDVEAVRALVVPVGLPVGHALHPGSSWVRTPVIGGVLDLGLGLRRSAGAASAPDGRVVPLASGVLADAGVSAAGWWPQLAQRLDELGRLAVMRLERDATTVVTPIGDCDALTLLGSPTLRQHLADGDGVGMRSVAAPMRSRLWFDLTRIDPAFVVAAAAATEIEQRGVERPLLVTADEVAHVEPRGTARRNLVLDDAPTQAVARPLRR